MKHLGTKRLETTRLVLRRFKTSDAKLMFDNWASDNEVTRFLTWPTHNDEKVSLNVINDWIDSYKNDDFYNWVIVIKDTNEVIGNISVARFVNDVPEIGYVIGKKWWNNGFTSEALSVVIEFLFKAVYVDKIIARHDVKNVASGKVMKKCNMTYVETVINGGQNNSGVCDISYYEINR